MKKLQVPYNLDPDIIDYYCNYKDYIAEVYFAAPPTLFPTARQFSGKNEEEYIQELSNICFKLKKNNIKTMLLLNGTNVSYTNELFERLTHLIYLLAESGLTGVVIANPILGEYISKAFPFLKIRLSVLSNINTIEKISQLEKLGYIHEICLTSDWLKDIDKLKKLRQYTNLEYSIIVNSTCRLNCPLYGWHHMVFNSNSNWELDDFQMIYDNFFSQTQKLEQNIFKSPFLFPEELIYYDDYIDYFKLEDRTLPSEALKNIVYYYIYRINPKYIQGCLHGSCVRNALEGPVEIKKISKDWRARMRNCKGECYKCNYCDLKVKELIEYEKN